MKKIISILLFISCVFNGYTQIDTINYKVKIQVDTLPVIMLVCDTSLNEYNTKINDKVYTYIDFNNSVFWRIGYEVSWRTFSEEPDNAASIHHNPDGSWTDDLVQHWKIIEHKESLKYLDVNKKELNKNIIVWMVK